MITIDIEHCNNVSSARIKFKKNALNIKYAMNGTGKTTISQAVEAASKGAALSKLKPFGSEHEPKCNMDCPISKTLVFNEEFVNQFVFRESQVISNAFEVFIKSADYETKQTRINERLRQIHINTSEDQDLGKLLTTGQAVLSKFTKTKKNELKQTGLLKSLTSSESIFKLPEPIRKFQPLMEKEYNVEWVGWKNDGTKFDDNDICPFCTTHLHPDYETEKKTFSESYSKSNVKNIKEMLSYIDSVSEYLNQTKRNQLYASIKETKDEKTITLWVTKLYFELEYLVNKVKDVIEFNQHKVKSEEISKLEEHLKTLIIDSTGLELFGSKKISAMIEGINKKVAEILKETDLLKKDIGVLKGLIGSSIKRTVSDVNEFLQMAGINYFLEIRHESENNTQALLKYRTPDHNEIQLDNIKLHLSWGERNAFALVLFMHYAISQNPDLIILDDPISSFDSNKKYAIINRLFQNHSQKQSLFKKTVVMFTHDFQPVIDFIVNSKPHGGSANSFFLRNKGGVVKEIEIAIQDIKSLPILLHENAANVALNIVHRIISLRKLLEHTKMNPQQEIAYNVLSSLLHARPVASQLDGTPIPTADVFWGESEIKKWIGDFSYSSYLSQLSKNGWLVNQYKSEMNEYFKLQVFRIILAINNLRSRIEDPLLKYIDEQFHVENDYIFYLDFNKYNIVPEFVIPKCDEFLKKEKLI